ncbi:MAG TPA: ABC transporter ATP-binding protein [Candidatus Dormibacteraeota bacterium]|nr:ABC transporter ATP-binding protein [Candidatus Dormibacteraeota bacterium]
MSATSGAAPLAAPWSDTQDEAASAASSAIHISSLSKRYGPIAAVKDLTMTVPRGEVFGFLGPNGAGKTTSVKMLLGLTAPTSGEAWVLGSPIGDKLTRRRVGYLPELFRYQSWLSAAEVLSLHCELAGIPKMTRPAELDRVLKLIGLSGRSSDRVGGFSKGMQQRLGLGVALLGRPELVILDEPTSALDPVGRRDVREIIRRLKADGTAVFLNSHLLTEVEQVCDRAAIVDHGTVIATGTLRDLLGIGGVRVRAAGLEGEARRVLEGFGAVRDEDEGWVMVSDLAEAAVPDMVNAVVAAGARLYAVEPRHQSLEERFIELLGDAGVS